MPSPPQAAATTLAAIRALWGTALLVVPAHLLRATGSTPTRTAVGVARVLGGRHLLQAAATTIRPTSLVRWGAAADAAHAATGLALAAASCRWRRTALIDSVVAAGFAAAILATHHRDRNTCKEVSL